MYVRWGADTCAAYKHEKLLYVGRTVGPSPHTTGSGANHLCLETADSHLTGNGLPVLPTNPAADGADSAQIWSTEYDTSEYRTARTAASSQFETHFLISELDRFEVPCAVCVRDRAAGLTEPCWR